MSKRHLLVLTDKQLISVLTSLQSDAEDWAASGEDHHPADKAREVLKRQQFDGLNPSELVWAMEEVVRQDKRRQKERAE